ncbi:hypothetical protein [Shewanella waksmanii]|uniref:hypothetical protein n=2 Tax=Shewanella TaxID=22 RepID=UPI0004910C19|nr:hypothetical protein [Shewanella waksmanii]
MTIAMANGRPTFNSSTRAFFDEQLSQRIQSQLDTKTLFDNIDAISGLTGAGVVYIDGQFNIVELRPFEPVCRIDPVKIVLREPPKAMNQAAFASHLRGSQGNIRESKLVSEVAGTILSCGAAFIGWTVILGSGAAIPLTGGTSSVVTYLAVGAASASALQCANGGIRTFNEYSKPQFNDLLDSNEWYRQATRALDLISLAGAGAASASMIKTIKMMQVGTSKSTLQILKGLSRPEKRRLNNEIARLNLPGASGRMIKSLSRKGLIKKYTGTQITHAFRLQLKDAVGASLSFSGSALTGTVKALAIGVYEEVND